MNRSIGRAVTGLTVAVVLGTILTGCNWLGASPGPTTGELPAGTLELRKSGGFAGVEEAISIDVTDDAIRKTVRAGPQDARTGTVRPSDAQALWETLRGNDAFSLGDNDELRDALADVFQYELTLDVGSRQHQFAVYAPEALRDATGEGRYARIVEAIESLAMQDIHVLFDLRVEHVQFTFLESFPVQVVAQIDGMRPNPCVELHEITQSRNGNTVHLHVEMKQDIDVSCIQVTEPFETRVKLDGVFPPDDYEVIVNGASFEFTT